MSSSTQLTCKHCHLTITHVDLSIIKKKSMATGPPECAKYEESLKKLVVGA